MDLPTCAGAVCVQLSDIPNLSHGLSFGLGESLSCRGEPLANHLSSCIYIYIYKDMSICVLGSFMLQVLDRSFLFLKPNFVYAD